jgi:acyl-CoA thioesterase YciA
MPGDTNPYGDIFGGWLMSQMDLAGGLIASRVVGGRAVTVAVDGMSFLRPVSVGDEVSVYGTVEGVGRTSLKVRVEAWRRDRHSEAAEMVTQALFTFVAVDRERHPTPITAAAARRLEDSRRGRRQPAEGEAF